MMKNTILKKEGVSMTISYLICIVFFMIYLFVPNPKGAEVISIVAFVYGMMWEQRIWMKTRGE